VESFTCELSRGSVNRPILIRDQPEEADSSKHGIRGLLHRYREQCYGFVVHEVVALILNGRPQVPGYRNGSMLESFAFAEICN
jgi:hypothetical protein